MWDYQRVGFHRFRHACGTILHGLEKRPAQAQAWLRHAQLTTTMNIYTHLDDDGLGSADAFDEILGAGTAWDVAGPRVHLGSTGHPETAANASSAARRKPASQSQIS